MKHTQRHTPHAHAALLVCAGALMLSALFPSAAVAGPFKAGFDVFVPSGASGTVDSTVVDNFAGDADQKTSEDFDGDSGLGLTVWGSFNVIPRFDIGLALHFIPTLAVADNDKNSFELGSQLDFNLRVGSTIPLGVVDLAIYGEGGLTAFSLTDVDPPTACDTGGSRSRLCRLYDTGQFDQDKTESLGFNAGAGVAVRYGVVPFFGLRLGLDFQYYDVQLFNGSSPDSSFTADLTGTRFRLHFGVDFDL